MELDCPLCGRPTDSLRQYRCLKWCVFLLAGAIWQEEYVRACPRCARRHLWKRAAMNVVPANFLWPLLVLPWTVVLTLMSRRKGHSPIILKELEAAQRSPPASPFATRRVMEVRDDVSWGRVAVVVAWLTFWMPVLGVLPALLAWLLNRRAETWTAPASRAVLFAAGLAQAGWVLFVALVLPRP